MDTPVHTLPKEERLSCRKDISDLLAHGTFCDAPGQLRFCYRKGTGSGLNRIMVSVPKKHFRRAVKRNLLKRRIRESYRKQKHLLDGKKDLRRIVDELEQTIRKGSLAALCENSSSISCMAMPRRQEIFACFDRYRSLKM